MNNNECSIYPIMHSSAVCSSPQDCCSVYMFICNDVLNFSFEWCPPLLLPFLSVPVLLLWKHFIFSRFYLFWKYIFFRFRKHFFIAFTSIIKRRTMIRLKSQICTDHSLWSYLELQTEWVNLIFLLDLKGLNHYDVKLHFRVDSWQLNCIA